MSERIKINLFKHSEDAKSYSAGDVIFQEGDPGNVMYVINEGEIDILVKDTLIETVEEGDVFGEMALIDGNQRSGKAVAKTDCTIVPINEKRFAFLVQQAPHFAIEIMRILVGRLRHMDALLKS